MCRVFDFIITWITAENAYMGYRHVIETYFHNSEAQDAFLQWAVPLIMKAGLDDSELFWDLMSFIW